MIDIIIGLAVFAAVAAAVAYIVRQKKKGAVCIGCPSACTCSKKNSGGCKTE